MEPKKSALRKRQHHAPPIRAPYTWATPHPERSVIPAAALDDLQRIFADMLVIPDTHCEACGRDILRGHTCYHVIAEDDRRWLTCWECGEVIMQFCGFAIAAEFPTTPPYGGGRNPAPGVMSNT